MTAPSQTPKAYLIRAGKHGQDENYCLDDDVSMLGFHDFPNLAAATTPDAMRALVQTARPDMKLQAVITCAAQLSMFAHRIKVGDIVALPLKRTPQIALGITAGPYEYREINGQMRHVRNVRWKQKELPRLAFGQDLLHSLGSSLTVCSVSRNDAARRLHALLSGRPDSDIEVTENNPAAVSNQPDPPPVLTSEPLQETPSRQNLEQVALDEIVAFIQRRFREHDLSRLVEAVLIAEGWTTYLSPPGPDGGVDILAARGSLGLDPPKLAVQVKSQNSLSDVTVYRNLRGAMQAYGADQGLLVCWGGFNRAVRKESLQSYFAIRLWDAQDLVKALFRVYDSLPEDIQAEIPLTRIWTLLPDTEE